MMTTQDNSKMILDPTFAPIEPRKTSVSLMVNQDAKRRSPNMENHYSKMICRENEMEQNCNSNKKIGTTDYTDVSIKNSNTKNTVAETKMSSNVSKEALALELEMTQKAQADSRKKCEQLETQLEAQMRNVNQNIATFQNDLSTSPNQVTTLENTCKS